jgi:hypothetical protein
MEEKQTGKIIPHFLKSISFPIFILLSLYYDWRKLNITKLYLAILK